MNNAKMRSLTVQCNHVGSCLLLYAILQDMAEKTQMTVYAIKQKATLERTFANQINLSPFLEFA